MISPGALSSASAGRLKGRALISVPLNIFVLAAFGGPTAALPGEAESDGVVVAEGVVAAARGAVLLGRAFCLGCVGALTTTGGSDTGAVPAGVVRSSAASRPAPSNS